MVGVEEAEVEGFLVEEGRESAKHFLVQVEEVEVGAVAEEARELRGVHKGEAVGAVFKVELHIESPVMKEMFWLGGALLLLKDVEHERKSINCFSEEGDTPG